MKTTVKRCLSAVLFLTLFAYLFVHVSYMVRAGLAHTGNNLSGYYDLDDNTLDVVFVGTSGTFSAFSPMDAWGKYGFASYNFCLNVLAEEAMANAVHEAMKTQSPEVLVIDIFPFIVANTLDTMEEYMVRYNTDGYRYSLDRLKLILDKVPDTLDKFTFVFDLVKYHSNRLNWRNFFGSSPFLEKGYNYLGWEIAHPAKLTDERAELEKYQMDALEELLAECGRQQVRNILFIYYPYGDVEQLRVRLGMEDILDQAMVNTIRDRVEEAGYTFLNCVSMREEFGLDYQKDYWGEIHFNIYGAEKVTTVVGRYLKDTYDLPDRREEPAYADWNDDLAAYAARVESEKAIIDQAIEENNVG